MEPPVSQIDRVRRALSPDFAMSNNSTPATDQMKKSTSVSEEEWKTPRKEGYPDQSPRSSARKWLKSEEALLTNFAKKAANNPGSFSEKIEIGALGRELQLPMSFPWPIFPGLDQDLFPPHGFPRFLGFDSKTVQRSALCRSRRELSNEYLLAKIGVDTAENEPSKSFKTYLHLL